MTASGSGPALPHQNHERKNHQLDPKPALRDIPSPGSILDGNTGSLLSGNLQAVFLKNRAAVSDRFLEIMRRCTYNLFAIGGWIGDRGVTGALIARKHALPHGIWFDRVESQVILNSSGIDLRSRIAAQMKSAVVRFNERRLLKHADLALLHGRTVFEQLGPLARNPHIVENIHHTDEDRIARLVNSVPFSLTMQAGLPQSCTSLSRSRATRGPKMLVSPIKHRFPRQASSLIARMRSPRDHPL